MKPSKINAHSQVTLHFSLSVVDGLTVDSTFDKSAATFVMGDGSLLPSFEKYLLDLQVGDEKTFVLPPSEAFGEINAESVHQLDARQFKNMALSEGLVVSFEGAGKQPMPGVVRRVVDDKVTVDFNHPLAGQSIKFSVKIMAVTEVLPTKIEASVL